MPAVSTRGRCSAPKATQLFLLHQIFQLLLRVHRGVEGSSSPQCTLSFFKHCVDSFSFLVKVWYQEHRSFWAHMIYHMVFSSLASLLPIFFMNTLFETIEVSGRKFKCHLRIPYDHWSTKFLTQSNTHEMKWTVNDA